MQWLTHGERFVYENPWVSVSLVDVEIPGERRFEHHVVHSADASGVLMVDEDDQVLLLWRHRFVTDTWGWEIPAGRIDPGEDPLSAAHREGLEETGWEPGPLRHLLTYHPINGVVDVRFHAYVADGAHHRGEPSDPSESERVEWIGPDRLRRIVRDGEMPDGLSLTACAYALAFDFGR